MLFPLTGIFFYFLISVLTWFVNPVMRIYSGEIVRVPNNHTIFNNLLLSTFLAILFVSLSFLMDFILKEDRNYEQANQEKIRAERFKAELITNMSHDMKTPLTSLISYVDLLKKLPIENPKFKEYTEVLDRKSLRLKHLISDFERCFKALKDVGYDGYVTFEDFSSAETSDQKLKTNIELIRGIVDKVWAE